MSQILSEGPIMFSDTGEGHTPGEDDPNQLQAAWRILVVDDDDEVHRATHFALRHILVDGRSLELIHADSADAARKILEESQDIAVAMIDVVMETPDAGLTLVDTIRNELGNTSIRIVLRTGQPGYAPELEVVRRYDINDYRTKAELTQNRLVTTLTAAIRAYDQIERVQAANRGMETVARAANEIFKLRTVQDFSRILIKRIEELLQQPVDGIVCLQQVATQKGEPGLYIEYATGCYHRFLGTPVSSCLDIELQRVIHRCMAARTSLFEPMRVLMWLGHGRRDAVAVLDLPEGLSELSHNLIQMYASSLEIGFENVDLIERLDFFAFRDALTHLSNRSRFISEIDQDLFKSHGHPYCLAIFDVVGFSEVNDSLGLRSGDSLLVAVAKRLRTSVGPEVLLARLSSDSFAAYGPEGAINAEAIHDAFVPPFFIHGHVLSVQLRIGIVRLEQCSGNSAELMRGANLAIRQMRIHGLESGTAYFSPDMAEDARVRAGILAGLRAAVDFGRGLSLVFQPVINVRTEQVVCIEALLRWHTDMGEDIPPERFIPLAEQTGLINELGTWVLEQAVEQLDVWHMHGFTDLDVSVNISPSQLQTRGFADKLVELLRRSGTDLSHVCLEITNGACLVESPELLLEVERLRSAGINLLTDNFGLESVSLRRLMESPVDRIKLAAEYVQMLSQGDSACQKALSVVRLASLCARTVVAKGVESEEAVAQLLSAGCETMQGFHFAPPMTSAQLIKWLQARAS